MNSNSQSSLDEQIDRYKRQLLLQYAQSAAVPTAPQPPMAAAPAEPNEPTEPMTETSVQPIAATPMPAPMPAPMPTPMPAPGPTAAPGITPADEYRIYSEENQQRGILRVQALTARSTYPVEGAKVIISKVFESGEYVIATQETDNAGKTEGLLLPAPDRSLSESPGTGKKPFAEYKLTLIHPEFATIVANRLPVFAGESSMQVLNMTPLAASPSGDTIQYITTEPSDL